MTQNSNGQPKDATEKRIAATSLEPQLQAIRGCRHCETEGLLPEARPVFQISRGAPIGLFGQAPGQLAHQSGRPFDDPSGKRLRSWLGVDEACFYDARVFAIIPMAFCFPGYDRRGADKPPPKVCAQRWRAPLMAELARDLTFCLLIGRYSQDWHMPEDRRLSLSERVTRLRNLIRDGRPVTKVPLPHPSWRNNAWLRKHPWFEAEVLPWLRQQIAVRLPAR